MHKYAVDLVCVAASTDREFGDLYDVGDVRTIRRFGVDGSDVRKKVQDRLDADLNRANRLRFASEFQIVAVRLDN